MALLATPGRSASERSDADSFVDIDVPPIAWVGLLATIVAMLAVDLVLHRGDKEPTPGARSIESLVWVTFGLTLRRSSSPARGAARPRASTSRAT